MKNYGQFHDGLFEGLWIPEKGKGEVYLSTTTGERFTALFTGIVALKAADFKQGNIIFDVTVRTAEEITLLDIAELYDLQPDRQPGLWEDQLLEKAHRENFQLFQISASYGGYCLVLCKDIELRESNRQTASG